MGIIAILLLLALLGVFRAAVRFVCGPWPRQIDGETFQSFGELVHWHWQYAVGFWDMLTGKWIN